MANLKSAIKRARQGDERRAHNQAFKTEMRTHIKNVETFVNANDLENAKQAFQTAAHKIDKVVQKGIIHRNNGNRQKARLASKIKQISK